MNFQLNKNIEHTIIQDVKQMRNLESHWQTGKIFFRENDQKISIKFVTKKSNQIFLTRDLFKNNVAYYNKNFTTLNLYKSMFFWCNTLEKDLTFKNILQDINGSNTRYQDIFLRKKKVLYFLKLKTQSQILKKKIIKNLLKIKQENIISNFIIFKNYKTLFNFFFKKLILRRIFKIQSIQFQLEKFLFVFLLRCKNYKTLKKQQFKFLFFSNKSFLIPISLVRNKKGKTLSIAQKHMISLAEKTNYYNYTSFEKQNIKNTEYKVFSKKRLNIDNDYFKKYLKIFLKIKKH